MKSTTREQPSDCHSGCVSHTAVGFPSHARTETSGRKELRLKDLPAQYKKSPPHIHPPPLMVPLHFLRNCRAVSLYVSRCVGVCVIIGRKVTGRK